MKIIVAVVLLSCFNSLSLAKQSKSHEVIKAKYYDKKNKFAKKSKKKAIHGEHIRLEVPIVLPVPPPIPDAIGIHNFDYYLLAIDGTLNPIHEDVVSVSVLSGWINTDGSVSVEGQKQGILAIAHPQHLSPHSVPVPLPIIQKSPDLQITPMIAPHINQDASIPLSPGEIALYYARLPDGHVFQITDANKAQLQASGVIRPDGSIAPRGINNGLTRVVTPPQISQRAPVPNKQRTIKISNKHRKSPPHSPIAPLIAPHRNQDVSAPVPTGSTALYYMRLPDGSIRQLTDINKSELQASGTIRADGSIAPRGVDGGLIRVVVPPKIHQSTPTSKKLRTSVATSKSGKSLPQTSVIVPHPDYQLKRTPQTHLIYFAPKEVQHAENEREVLTPEEVNNLLIKGYIHPDGSLTANALKMGYSSTVLTEGKPKLVDSKADIQKHFEKLNDVHKKIIETQIALNIDKNLKLEKKSLYSLSYFRWLWLLLLIPIFTYIYKRSKAV